MRKNIENVNLLHRRKFILLAVDVLAVALVYCATAVLLNMGLG